MKSKHSLFQNDRTVMDQASFNWKSLFKNIEETGRVSRHRPTNIEVKLTIERRRKSFSLETFQEAEISSVQSIER